MTTRCKLRCAHIEKQGQVDDPYWTVRFDAVWEGDSKIQEHSENAVFGKLTPSATFYATIRNPDAVAKWKVGTEYYFDISESTGWNQQQIAAAKELAEDFTRKFNETGNPAFAQMRDWWTFGAAKKRVPQNWDEINEFIAQQK